MPRSLPTKSTDDPFDGLLLPMEAWKAIDEAHITSLRQLKSIVPQIIATPSIDPGVAQIIKDRVDRLAARRKVRVNLVFPKQVYCKTEGTTAHRHRLIAPNRNHPL
ncbi:hypothetical protein ILT44_26700 [Microvirga sp. BT689]|uniref:hypothetical protein n=1 Tax=Microvirga arvi TaxID=2778731 RepID=UPI0019507FD5|nr:hypothetical protein [Microvirga arvi]MBM6583796.1 hypothetical protein [Microvirga arvi]